MSDKEEKPKSEGILDTDTSSGLFDTVDETAGKSAKEIEEMERKETERRHTRMLALGQAIFGGVVLGLGYTLEELGKYAPRMIVSGKKYLAAARTTFAKSKAQDLKPTEDAKAV